MQQQPRQIQIPLLYNRLIFYKLLPKSLAKHKRGAFFTPLTFFRLSLKILQEYCSCPLPFPIIFRADVSTLNEYTSNNLNQTITVRCLVAFCSTYVLFHLHLPLYINNKITDLNLKLATRVNNSGNIIEGLGFKLNTGGGLIL